MARLSPWKRAALVAGLIRSFVDHTHRLHGRPEEHQVQPLAYSRAAVHQQLMDAGVEPGRLAFCKGTAAEVAAHRGAPGYRFVYDAAEQP